ncbi:MAG: hypothetical protein HQL99_11260 [Magnetococcales bacterium]|nr:hypothetical protein [Magnetococcales bacterium]
MKVNASLDANRTAATLERRGRKPQAGNHEVSEEVKANVTDPGSRIMKARKGWIQGYNTQAVVSEDQIIGCGRISPAGTGVV